MKYFVPKLAETSPAMTSATMTSWISRCQCYKKVYRTITYIVLFISLVALRNKDPAPFRHPVDVFCLFVPLSGNILPDIVPNS
jgi:hypothetical protein